MNPEIDLILAKYFTGEASEKELEVLDRWLCLSEDNEAYFDQMTLLFQQSHPAAIRRPNTEAALTKFLAYISESTSQEKENSKSTIISPTGKEKKFRIYWQVAATAAIFIVATFFIYRINNTGNNEETLIAENTPMKHLLADSTDVILAEHSTMSYSEDFGIGNREISLAGKATFEVVKHTEKKLVISAGETFIEDIGTVFTVEAYTGDTDITVTVESGKVLFYTSTDKGIEIGAGQTGVFNKVSKQFTYEIENTETTGKTPIVFTATPLREVLALLTGRYGVKFRLGNEELGDLLITVSFDNEENISYVMEIIAETLLLTVQQKDGLYILTTQN